MEEKKRGDRVAETVHFAAVHHYENGDNITRLTAEELQKPLNFAKFTDIETTNFVRGLIRLGSDKKMTPIGLRVDETTVSGHVGKKATVLLQTIDQKELYLLYTFGATGRRDSYFTWQLKFHHRFNPTVSKPRMVEKPASEAPQRIKYGSIVFTSENNSLIYDGESKCIFMYGTSTLIVNGRRVRRHIDVPVDFLKAVDANRRKIPLNVILMLQKKLHEMIPEHVTISYVYVLKWLITNNSRLGKPKTQ